MFSRNRITAGFLAVTAAFGLGACDNSSPVGPSSTASPSTAEPQDANNSQQVGLVNVSAGDVALLNNVNLAVAANVVANLCGITVPVAVLAQQVIAQGGEFTCTGATDPIRVDQSTGGGPIVGGSNNSRQAGLVNVSLGDVAILNNVNVALAANVLVNACGLTVPIAIAAVQTVIATGAPAGCETAAGPIRIIQG